jgi:hypothetical protein
MNASDEDEYSQDECISNNETFQELINDVSLSFPNQPYYDLDSDTLYFPWNYNHSLDPELFYYNGKIIPNIVFGYAFNWSIDYHTFPLGIKSIIFGDQFNAYIPPFTLPKTIEILHFGDNFNRPLLGLPAALKELYFYGRSFNNELHLLGTQLEKLYLSKKFNRPLHDLPSTLKLIEFGNEFNCYLDLSHTNVEYISFKSKFNNTIILPETLQSIIFGDSFNRIFNIPQNLRHLYFGKNFNQSFEKLYNHTNNNYQLEKIVFGAKYNCPIDSLQSFQNLQSIVFNERYTHVYPFVPQSMKMIHIPKSRFDEVRYLETRLLIFKF